MSYTSKHNHVFSDFKNIHEGQDAILFCTGPSKSKFKFNPTFDSCIKVGTNKIYKNNNITSKLDYYFFGSHYHLDSAHREGIHSIKDINSNVVFFSSTFTAKFGDGREVGLGNINLESALSLGAIPFECGAPGSGPGTGWIKRIDKYPFYGGSIAFPAVQFLLFTGVSKIYLVGSDCGPDPEHTIFISFWKSLPAFLDKNYPESKIISVNPVGLRGMFPDLYL